ncbi:basic secretory protein-like protein [Zhouia sp. PK063]|uniref:basic secretory protein-like protein n=1 Tax=Zhouia sp. PK063 TaxID=3373602 RepID=UPI0037BA0BEA
MIKNLMYVGIAVLGITTAQAQKTETFTKKGKTLILTNEDPNFNAEVKEGLINTFFTVYPKLCKTYNKKAIDTVRVKIDTSYTGVAYANNGSITISSAWLHKMPKDTDVITHEVMHLVQAYGGHSGPGWLTEGIADYVRYKFGVANKEANWSLPDYKSSQSYANSYRVTARFLLWITENYDKKFVKKMDKHMRSHTYSPELWEKYTGKTLDELWKAYGENPKLS